MAEENAAAKEAAPAAQNSGGSGKQTIILLALAVVNMVVVGAVAFMLYKSKSQEQKNPGVAAVERGEHQTQEAERKAQLEDKGKPVIPLETFIVNLAGSKGRRVAKINIELELSKIEVKSEIEKRQAQIRDIIIMILSSKTYEFVSSKDGKDQLREEIKDTVNAFLSHGKIEGVFFTEFIYN